MSGTVYQSGTYTLLGAILPVSAQAAANATVTFNLAGALDTFNIYSQTGANVTVNNTVDVANTLNLNTNGGNLTLATTVGALGTTSVNVNGGSFTIGSSLIQASLLNNATLTFGASGGTAVFGSDTSLLNLSLLDLFRPIQGFIAANDAVDDPSLNFSNVTGYTISSTSTAGVQQIVVAASNGGSFTFDVSGTSLTNGTYTTANGPLRLAADASGGTDIYAAPCFLRGTRIATPGGEVPVESIEIGDLVLTASGQARPVQWVGQRSLSGAFLQAGRYPRPVRFTRGALGHGLPRRDLIVSPDHCMVIKGQLVAAENLVNGATILRESALEEITYFHIELATHDVLLAEGAPAESFRDQDSRILFENGRDGVTAPSPTEACLPVLNEGQALATMRAALEFASVQTVWLPSDGTFRIPVLPETRALRLRSPVARVDGDERLLGVAVTTILRDGVALDLGDAAFTAGWHRVEPRWRWTNGAGLLLTEGASVVEITVVAVAEEKRRTAA